MHTKKQLHITTGIAISLFISLLTFSPRPFRAAYTPSGESAVVSFINAFLCWLIIQVIIPGKTVKGVWLKAVVSISAGMLLSVLTYYCSQFFTDRLLMRMVERLPEKRKILILFSRGALVSGFLFFISYLLYISREAEKIKQESERLKKESLEARLYALQQQISPHFLFNALNTLRSIAPDKNTKDYVIQLSHVFRYLLGNNRATLATLRDELAFTGAYIHIMKERYEAALQVDTDLPERYLLYKLPPISLQLLIENAIKHNIISEEEPLQINIFIETGTHLWLVVRNNLQPKLSVEEGAGAGLNNIRERYQLLSGTSIEITSDITHFTVKLPLIAP